MSISVRVLRKILEDYYPDDAMVEGYDGEDTGLSVIYSDGTCSFIQTTTSMKGLFVREKKPF